MSSERDVVTERFIEVGGRSLRVRAHGQGPPVLLINGLGANVATWTPLIHQLAGFQVIAFDAPGVGRSDSPRAPYAISHLVNVAGQVLDEFGLDQADVLGYSLGGSVAQQLAMQHPDRVRRLALASASCGTGGVPGALRALLAVSVPARHYAKSGYNVTMRMIDLAPEEKKSAMLGQQSSYHQEALPSPLGYMLQMGAFTTFNSLPWLHRIEQPTLVLSGSEDRLMPMANSAILAAYLPEARLRVFEGWGHYLLHDPASGAGAAVAEYFRAASPDRSRAWRDGRVVRPDDMADYIRMAPKSAHFGYVTGGWVRRRFPLQSGKD